MFLREYNYDAAAAFSTIFPITTIPLWFSRNKSSTQRGYPYP